MNRRQTFGGDWTELKLSSLKKYLRQYALIMKDRKYKTVYIDAFAGTGYRFDPKKFKDEKQDKQSWMFKEMVEQQPDKHEGSATIALQTDPPFDLYVFVDDSLANIAELEKLKEGHPLEKRIKTRCEDANAYLSRICSEVDWKKYRAVLFLDPFGMTVKWKTLELIATTKAIDLWYLFPLGGGGANRLLTRRRSKIDPTWSAKLDDIFGTHDWHEEFYKTEDSLFKVIDDAASSNAVKKASFNQLKGFVMKRLIELFGEKCVAPNPRVLPNRKNSPLYLLCFATSNPWAAEPAIRIANYILENQ